MTFLRRASWAVEPLIAVVFTLLWINAEAGRQDTGLLGFLGLGLAIALSRVAAVPALALTLLTVVAQAVAAIGFGAYVGPFHATDWPAYFGIVIVVLLTTASGRLPRLWAPAAVGVVATAIAVAAMFLQPYGFLSWIGSGPERWYVAGPALAIGMAMAVLAGVAGFGLRRLIGLVVAEQTGLRAELADSRLQLALADERERVAAELHDVLAHSLTVIVAQADGARFLRTKRPAAMESALSAIAASARDALADVGAVIDGVLDDERRPQPGLDDLADLVESVRSAGLDVQLTWAGEPRDLAPGQQLAVYRIVQEALTNALRHRGRGSRAIVVLDARGPGLSIQVVSDGGETAAPDAAPLTSGRGRGIPGMAERARVAGGWLTAGPDDDGAHRVTAFVPYRETAAAA